MTETHQDKIDDLDTTESRTVVELLLNVSDASMMSRPLPARITKVECDRVNCNAEMAAYAAKRLLFLSANQSSSNTAHKPHRSPRGQVFTSVLEMNPLRVSGQWRRFQDTHRS
jgi:hypothetical protein